MEAESPPRKSDPTWMIAVQVLMLLVLIAIRFAEPVGDGDLFWQMAYGKYMLAHKTLIPDHTIYSWTPGDNPYLYCSWVAELALYLMYQVGGLTLLFAFRYGMVLFCTGLACSYAYQVGWHRRCLFWLMATWFVCSSYVGTILKPELFSFGLMSGLAWLIFRFRLAVRRQQPYRRYLVGLVLLMITWVNTHGVYSLGLTGLAVYGLGELLNQFLSPRLALPRPAFRHLCLAGILCGAGVFLNPYGPAYVMQSLDEFLSILHKTQSAGDKAAYSNLAAHLPIWRALAFQFHVYLAMGISLMVLLTTAKMLQFRESWLSRVDWPFVVLNLWFGYIYTVYLRSTFYWPPFLLYSSLYLFELLGSGKGEVSSRDGEEPWLDFFFAGANALFLCLYFPNIDRLAGLLRLAPVQAIQVLFAAGVLVQTTLCTLYLGMRYRSQQRARVGYFEVRSSLASLALVTQLYLGYTNCSQAIWAPYASSWFGFGITYWNPVDEVEFIKKFHPNLKSIINDYDSGGYLLWSLFPQTKVMIDPRSFPFRKFWVDYINYEHGQLGLEFLDRFSEKPEVSLVSLKNVELWRSYLRSGNWVTGWVGTAYIVFVKKGFQYPPEAAQYYPERFETMRNGQRAFNLFQFAIEANFYDLAWQALEVMERRFNSTPQQQHLLANLKAYKASITALQAKDLDTALAAQEQCLAYGTLVNSRLLLQMYQLKLAQLKKAKGEQSPEYQQFLQRAQETIRRMQQMGLS